MSRFAMLLAAWVVGMSLQVYRGEAMEIQRIATPSGIEAWLVEDHRLPIVFVEIFWRAGSSSETDGLDGLAYMLSGMLDEGAGDIDSEAFQKRLADLNIDLEFNASKDFFSARIKTLEENLDEAIELLALALTRPRFDEEALERVRAQILASLKQSLQNPEIIASRAWFAAAFADHPYARTTRGTAETVQAIQADDLRDWMSRALARDNIGVTVVGDVTPERLEQLLEEALAGLPQKAKVATPEAAAFQAPGHVEVIEYPNPQSLIQFGHDGITRDDPDFIAAYVMNHVLGGSVLVSRLGEEVREKRGLAYSVYSYLYPLDHASLFAGSLATENARAGEALKQVRLELARMQKEGVSQKELDDAKAYLVGSYPLRFDSNEKIALQLSYIQREELGIDYIDRRNALIESVTRDDVFRAAQRLLDPEKLLVVIVGEPELSGAP
ncbi:MAG: pitrilysin family protein [Hyphomicrobiales bacterium]|nr:pitrilysin family protein [Hyphomicrobiales bacterium]MCY4049331.1 pitrilysin family protein [Hyphomicrobiales bacterium]